MSLIILSIPIFFLLIGIELLLDRFKKTRHYRLNDAITNINCGIGSQISGIFLKTFIYIGYYYLYENHRLFQHLPHPGSGHSLSWLMISWISLFIGIDFFYYWFHRLAHEISFLWGSHIVHHQSEDYNLTVALRQAWLQGAFSWIFYLPLALIGFDPVMFITVNAFQTLYQFWIHTQHIHKMPPWFEFIFNTPSHHRVHHGVNPKYIDKNHGGTLILFDRWFGTFQEEEEEVVYGITQQPKSWNPIKLNFEYWFDLFHTIPKAKNLQDAWKMWWGKPGWRPDYLGGTPNPKSVTPKTFQKFDVAIPVPIVYYSWLQFILVLLGASAFLFYAEQLTGWQRLSGAASAIATLYSLGMLLENKASAFSIEVIRLLFMTILGFTSGHAALFWVSIGYAFISLIILSFIHPFQFSSVISQE